MSTKKFAYPTTHHRYHSSSNSIDRAPSTHSTSTAKVYNNPSGSRSVALRSRGTSIRSSSSRDGRDVSSSGGLGGGNVSTYDDPKSVQVLQSQIRRLARTCDVEFLERIVPSDGPKDSKDKEEELVKRLMRHVAESKAASLTNTADGRTVSRSGSRAGNYSTTTVTATDRKSKKSKRVSISSQTDIMDDDDNQSTRSGFSGVGSVSGGTAFLVGIANVETRAQEKSRTVIEQSLKSLLRQLKRCESSKALTPSFKDKLFMRKALRYQGSKDFVKIIKRGIKTVENMLLEAAGLGHSDLSASLTYSNDSFEREVSYFLNRGSKASEIPWETLSQRASQIVEDARIQWERAAEARRAFESFAQICLSRHQHQFQMQLSAPSQMSDVDRMSGEIWRGGSRKRDDGTDDDRREDVYGIRTRRDDYETRSSSQSIKRSLTDASDRSMRSFYRDLATTGGGDGVSISARSSASQDIYQSPRTRHGSSNSLPTFRKTTTTGGPGGITAQRTVPDPLTINVARWGGDQAATTDLISRIRALQSPQSPMLTHIQEED